VINTNELFTKSAASLNRSVKINSTKQYGRQYAWFSRRCNVGYSRKTCPRTKIDVFNWHRPPNV